MEFSAKLLEKSFLLTNNFITLQTCSLASAFLLLRSRKELITKKILVKVKRTTMNSLSLFGHKLFSIFQTLNP